MLFFVQFPLADCRWFLKDGGHRLRRPAWPQPVVGSDFTRASGAVRFRRRGGIGGEHWESEDSFCDVRRLIRFRESLRSFPSEGGPRLAIRRKVAFRRLYFDGRAAGKVEVGFVSTPRGATLGVADFQQFCNAALDSMVTIPAADQATGHESRSIPLIAAGHQIAWGYHVSTSRHGAAPALDQSWRVTVGKPLVVIETEPDESVQAPAHWLGVHLAEVLGYDLSLAHAIGERKAVAYQLWFLNRRSARYSEPKIRNLRLWLSRIHAEKETLNVVLRHLADRRLLIPARSPLSDAFQRYVMEAIQRLRTYGAHVERQLGAEMQDAALRLDTIVHPGYIRSILTAIEQADLRPAVKTKLFRYVETQDQRTPGPLHIGTVYRLEQFMDNRQYHTVVSGTGHTVTVAITTMEQCFNQAAQSTLPDHVGIELEKLRGYLRELIPQLDEQKRQSVADDTETFVKEVTKPVPRKSLLEITGKGLIEAAETCAALAAPITQTVRSIVALLSKT